MNPHAPSARRPATHHDVLDAPANVVAEPIEGAPYPRPKPGRAVAGPSLTNELVSRFQTGPAGPGEQVRVAPAFPVSVIRPD